MPEDKDEINKDDVREFFNGGRTKQTAAKTTDKTGTPKPDGDGVPSPSGKG